MLNINKYIQKNKKFVIAEIGHNHQGDINKAKKLIKAAKDAGADAVKFQKRHNKELYTEKFYNSPYDNPNSYAKTYGLHRDFLEFNLTQFKILKSYAKKLKIIFFLTAFDFKSVDFCMKLNVPCFKLASGDLTNLPLQEYVAKQNKHVFLSTGGGNMSDVDRAVKNILRFNKNLSILHCTASYPADPEDMNLNVIPEMVKKYKKHIIGLSDHENGIDAASVAYMLGARIFEKHFTLNRSLKGTDQSFSLEPQGLAKLVRNLNRIPKLLGSKNKKILKSEKNPIYKMGKSLVASKNLLKGSKIELKDIAFKSPADGLKPYEYRKILNKTLRKNINKDQPILEKHVS